MNKMSRSTLLFLFSFILVSSLALAFPPPSVSCTNGNEQCIVTGTYGAWPDRTTCKAARVMYPKSEQDILQAVAFGTRNNLKMKVVTRLSHSLTKLVCPGGTQGLVISTRDYNKNIIVNSTALTVTVDSGVELHQFLNTLAPFDLAFPQSPYWNGLTLAGILSTGAHGSSRTGPGSAVHEYVVGMEVVVPASPEEGYAKVVRLTDTEQEQDLNAVKVSLGVLGVISKITLKVQPMFKRSVTITVKPDGDLEQLASSFGNGNEFGDIIWRSSLRQAVYRTDVRVPRETQGDGVREPFVFSPTSVIGSESARASEDANEATSNRERVCTWASIQANRQHTLAYGFKNGISFTGYPVVGYQNKMQTSGSCYDSSSPLFGCAWDYSIDGSFFQQTALSITLDKVSDFISDVKKLRSFAPGALCGPDAYGGILMRYVKSSKAYLGKPEDCMEFDLAYYRARDATTPRLDEDVFEEIEQMLVFKYQGIPHWGKNRNVAFLNVSSKYPGVGKFLDVKKRMDPKGLFSSEWSNAMLGIGNDNVTIDKDFCALEGLCICSKDSHCAPMQGYFCRPGKVFKQARVCEKLDGFASVD